MHITSFKSRTEKLWVKMHTTYRDSDEESNLFEAGSLYLYRGLYYTAK